MDGYKKSNIVIVMVVALLFLLISGVVYYFFFSDYLENNKEEKKDSLYVEITDENIIKELQDIIESNNLYILAEMEKDVDNMNSLELSYKLMMAFPTINNDKKINEVTTGEIDDYFKNTFETTMYWDNKDVYCSCGKVLYKYDLENNKYIYSIEHESHDEIRVVPYYSKVLEAKKKNDIYVIKMSYIWDKLDSSDDVVNKGFASFSDAYNEKNKLFEIEDDTFADDFINQNYETVKNNLHEYTYVFDKKDDKYLLVNFDYTE